MYSPCGCDIDAVIDEIWNYITVALTYWYILELVFDPYLRRMKKEAQ
jgi:hypothetical protein